MEINKILSEKNTEWKCSYTAAYNVARLMKENDVRQGKLAEDTGINSGTLSRYLNGKARFQLSHLAVLADYFKVSVVDLLTLPQAEKEKTLKDAADALQIVADAVGLPEDFRPQAGFLDCCLNEHGQFVAPDPDILDSLDEYPIRTYNAAAVRRGFDSGIRVLETMARVIDTYELFIGGKLYRLHDEPDPNDGPQTVEDRQAWLYAARKIIDRAKMDAGKDTEKAGITYRELMDARACLHDIALRPQMREPFDEVAEQKIFWTFGPWFRRMGNYFPILEDYIDFAVSARFADETPREYITFGIPDSFKEEFRRFILASGADPIPQTDEPEDSLPEE